MADLGPLIVAEGKVEGEDPVVDIVFVHGLRGDRIKTWSENGSEDGYLWPRDFLPQELPRARIITYGYDADMILFFNKSSENSIVSHARNLLTDLTARRRNPTMRKRPIIFVAHSLGGIVVKAALVDSIDEKSAGMGTRKADIATCTKGIIFMATPHRGSAAANWNAVAQGLASIFQEDHNERLVSALQTGSVTLEDLQNRFRRWIKSFKIATVLEGLEYGTLGKIVTADSATLSAPDEDVLDLHSSHVDMCRFASPEDNNYVRLLDSLKNMYEEVTGEGKDDAQKVPSAAMQQGEDTRAQEDPSDTDSETDDSEDSDSTTDSVEDGIIPSPITLSMYSDLVEAFVDLHKAPTDAFTRGLRSLRTFRGQKTGNTVSSDDAELQEPAPGYKQLVDGFNENSQGSQVRTLYLAALLGKEPLVIQLLEAGVSPNWTPNFSFEEVHLTPLAVAIAFHEDDTVELLLEREWNKCDLTLHSYWTKEQLEAEAAAAETQDESHPNEGDDEDSDEETKVEAEEPIDEQTAREALLFAAMFGSPRATQLVLARRGIDQIPPGIQILQSTVLYGLSETLRVLIEGGARVDESDEDGQTPLHYACMFGYLDETDVLLSCGADPNVQDAGKRNALHYAVSYASNNPGNENGNAIVQKLLNWSDPAIDLNAVDEDGDPAIQYAVIKPQCNALVTLLLEAGVSLKVKNKAGKTIIEQAEAVPNNKEIVNTIAGTKISRSWKKHKFGLGEKMSNLKLF